MQDNLSTAREVVHNPRQWCLYMALDDTCLDVMLHNPAQERSLLTGRLPLDSAKPLSQALRDAIYDCNVLLGDYRSSTLLVRNAPSTVIPAAIAATDLLEPLAAINPGDGPGRLLTATVPSLNAAVIYRMDSDTYHLVMRTFRELHITHPLAVEATYLHTSQGSRGDGVTHAIVRPGHVDIITYRGTNLLHCQGYDTTCPADTIYYITACRELYAGDDTQVTVSGDRTTLRETLEQLRSVIPGAAPLIFPAAMFRAGGNIALEAPADLIVTPLTT